MMALNVVPPLVLTSHCTVGVGLPLAAAVKVAVLPALTVWSAGFVVTVERSPTVNVAAVLVAVPALLVKTASYSLPLSAPCCREAIGGRGRAGDGAERRPAVGAHLPLHAGASDCRWPPP